MRRTPPRSSKRALLRWVSVRRSTTPTKRGGSSRSWPVSDVDDDVRELPGRLVLQDQLPPAVRHLLLLDPRLAVVLAALPLDPRCRAATPVVELHRLPLTRLSRRV